MLVCVGRFVGCARFSGHNFHVEANQHLRRQRHHIQDRMRLWSSVSILLSESVQITPSHRRLTCLDWQFRTFSCVLVKFDGIYGMARVPSPWTESYTSGKSRGCWRGARLRFILRQTSPKKGDRLVVSTARTARKRGHEHRRHLLAS